MKHTPGPLSYNGPHDTVYDIDKEHYMAYRVTDSGGKVIAYVASLEDTKLFKTAPDLLIISEWANGEIAQLRQEKAKLLNALENAVTYICLKGSLHAPQENWGASACVLEAKAAIAKATPQPQEKE